MKTFAKKVSDLLQVWFESMLEEMRTFKSSNLNVLLKLYRVKGHINGKLQKQLSYEPKKKTCNSIIGQKQI